MDSTRSLWSFISDSLKSNLNVVLLYVVESNGSSPGRQGFAMAVNQQAQMKGSIGGGIMEHKFVELAKERLIKNEKLSQIRRQSHNKSSSVDQSGMICSGEQIVVLQSLYQNDIDTIQHILNAIEKNEAGTLTLRPQRITFDNSPIANDYQFSYVNNGEWYYVEKIGFKDHVYIIGGGHCSLALSTLMRNLGFHVSVFEERSSINTFSENISAHKKFIVGNYSHLETLIPEGNNNYVVIMTFGYRTDDIALRTLAKKSFRYLGVLGSRKKMDSLLDSYAKDGINFRTKLNSPIGIQIKSQTPWEIAVSIAAEIIKVRNENK